MVTESSLHFPVFSLPGWPSRSRLYRFPLVKLGRPQHSSSRTLACLFSTPWKCCLVNWRGLGCFIVGGVFTRLMATLGDKTYVGQPYTWSLCSHHILPTKLTWQPLLFPSDLSSKSQSGMPLSPLPTELGLTTTHRGPWPKKSHYQGRGWPVCTHCKRSKLKTCGLN